MKRISFCLWFAVWTSFIHICADNDLTNMDSEILNCVQNVLYAKKTSIQTRAAFAIARQFARTVGALNLAAYVSPKDEKNECLHQINYNAQATALLDACLLASDFFIQCGDDVLYSLKKLEKCIHKLPPDKLEQIKPVFAKNYAEKLMSKIYNEQDCKFVNFCRAGVIGLDALWLLIFVVAAMLNIKNNGFNEFNLGLLVGVCLDFILNLYNVKMHPNDQKLKILARIQKTLAL